MPRPRNPKGIRPRSSDARAYEKAIKVRYLNPIIRRLQRKLSLVRTINAVYRLLDEDIEGLDRVDSAVLLEIASQTLHRIRRWNRQRARRAFKAALGIDVGPLLSEWALREFMEERISENVDLIKTIPRRYHEGLKVRTAEEFADKPFDQAAMRKVYRDEYKSTGWNLRRLTRDQSNKMTGQLTRRRHEQLGLRQFVWRSSLDERVRPTHRDFDSKTYAYENAPEGGPGVPILCRCIAEPVVSRADAERLKASVG